MVLIQGWLHEWAFEPECTELTYWVYEGPKGRFIRQWLDMFHLLLQHWVYLISDSLELTSSKTCAAWGGLIMHKALGSLLGQAFSLDHTAHKHKLESAATHPHLCIFLCLLLRKFSILNGQLHLICFKTENVSITREECLTDGAWPDHGSHRSSGSASTASSSFFSSANDELNDFGHISSFHVLYLQSWENNEDAAWNESIRSLTEIPVDGGSSGLCWQCLQGFVVLAVSLCKCKLQCFEPRCTGNKEEGQAGGHLWPGLWQNQHTQKRMGKKGMGWHGMGWLAMGLPAAGSLLPVRNQNQHALKAVPTGAV